MVILGLMSGTSLDGVDLAACRFKEDGPQVYTFEIIAADTIDYSADWKEKLNYLPFANAEELVRTDWELGAYFGELCKEFIQRHQLNVQVVASHGHTVFHNPIEGYTHQIGRGPAISKITDLPVVNDFRSMDIAYGGQGAPLVPVGDHFLFHNYDACLNLGGIANISFIDASDERTAFDIGPCNMVLNYLASQAGQVYDQSGALASKGKVHNKLMKELDQWDYYKREAPKSLGREQIESIIFPMLDGYKLSTEDKLATCTSHIAGQINRVARQIATLKAKEELSILVTGGGAYNDYLIQAMQKEAGKKVHWVVPEHKLIEFKEALIFAFLGYLRMNGKDNVWKNVTGASANTTGGAIYGPILPDTFS